MRTQCPCFNYACTLQLYQVTKIVSLDHDSRVTMLVFNRNREFALRQTAQAKAMWGIMEVTRTMMNDCVTGLIFRLIAILLERRIDARQKKREGREKKDDVRGQCMSSYPCKVCIHRRLDVDMM